MKTDSQKDIPLAIALTRADRPEATPLGVFKLARRFWLESKRICIGELASAVGVSRVTLYRWIGSKDRLIDEILWSFAKPTLEKSCQEVHGSGADYVVGVCQRFMTYMANFEPMQRFILDNPIFAVRIQTNNPESCHGRIITFKAKLITQEALRGNITLTKPAHELAEMMTCTHAALLYSAILGKRSVSTAIHLGGVMTRMLLQGELADAPDLTLPEELAPEHLHASMADQTL
ncbi:MAG: QsdR family transcriptional regulator [Desulfobacteraceae bacterium]|nr:QsdR family transcriptional regulator [Desulfobacteraceae bacterium]